MSSTTNLLPARFRTTRGRIMWRNEVTDTKKIQESSEGNKA